MDPSSVFVQYTGPRFFPENPVRQWLHALVRAGVFVLLGQWFFTASYPELLDAENQLLAAGVSLVPGTEPGLARLHPCLGWVFGWLYGLHSGTAWYALGLSLCHWLGISAAWLAIQRTGGGAWRSGAFWLVMLFVEIPFLQNPELGTSAFVLAQGAVLLLYTPGLPNRRPAWHGRFLTPFLLFVLSALFCWEAALLSAAVALPLCFAGETEQKKPRWWLCAGLLLLPLAMGIFLRGEAPGRVLRQHRTAIARKDLTGHRNSRYAWTADNAPRFARTGWNEHDHWLFQKGFSADPTVFGDSALIRVETALSEAEAPSLGSRVGRAFEVFSQMPPSIERRSLLFLLLIPSVPAAGRRRWALTGSILLAAGACMVLLGRFHLPQGLFEALFAFPILAGLWLTPPLQILGGCYRVFVTIAALWCAFFGVRTARDNSRQTASEYLRWHAGLERLDPRPEQLYLVSDELLRHVALPFKRPEDPLLRRFRAIPLHAAPDGNAFRRQLGAFGIGNLHAEIADRPNVLLLVPIADVELRDRYLVFLREHYGLRAQLERVWEDPQTGMGAWRVRRE